MIFDSKQLCRFTARDVARYVKDPSNYVKTTMKKHKVVVATLHRYSHPAEYAGHRAYGSHTWYAAGNHQLTLTHNAGSIVVSPNFVMNCCTHLDGSPIKESEFEKTQNGSVWFKAQQLMWVDTKTEYFVVFAPARNDREGPIALSCDDGLCAIVAPSLYGVPDMDRLCWYRLDDFYSIFNVVPFQKFFLSLSSPVVPSDDPIVVQYGLVTREEANVVAKTDKTKELMQRLNTLSNKELYTLIANEMKKPFNNRDLQMIYYALARAADGTWAREGKGYTFITPQTANFFSDWVSDRLYERIPPNSSQQQRVYIRDGKECIRGDEYYKLSFEFTSAGLKLTVSNGLFPLFMRVCPDDEFIRLLKALCSLEGKLGIATLSSRITRFSSMTVGMVKAAPTFASCLLFMHRSPYMRRLIHILDTGYYEVLPDSYVKNGYLDGEACNAFAKVIDDTNYLRLAKGYYHKYKASLLKDAKQILAGTILAFMYHHAYMTPSGKQISNIRFSPKGDDGYIFSFSVKFYDNSVKEFSFVCDSLLNPAKLFVNGTEVIVTDVEPIPENMAYAAILTNDVVMTLSNLNGIVFAIVALRQFLLKTGYGMVSQRD